MFYRKEKKIDFSKAFEKVKDEAADIGELAKIEAKELVSYVKNQEEKIVSEAREIYSEAPLVKKKKQRIKAAKIVRLAAPLLIGFFALFIILAGISFWMFAKIYFEAMRGKANIEQSVAFIGQGDFESSISFSKQAEINFKNALIMANEMDGSAIKYLPLIGSSVSDAKYLLSTASILSRTVTEGVTISKGMESLVKKSSASFSKFTPEEKGKVLAYLYQSSPELVGLKANLDLASLNLEKIKFSFLLFPIKGKIESLKERLDLGREILERAIPASKFLPELAGFPEKRRFLFLLQNSDELRPTGGFIGNYGIIETQNGDIVRFDTDDSYHLDMPVKDKLNIDPPAPVKEYLAKKWYFRDSNWQPDFTAAAKTSEWFFKQESGLAQSKENTDFSGIIAITPKFITDLLAITGPIILEGHEYNKDNFSELLEYRVEMGYKEMGESSWNRKQMVGKIANELKTRIFDLPMDRWEEIFKAIANNIDEKNILVYFNDCDLEELAVEEGIAGEQKAADNDYLMVVDSNMGSFKTDSVMNKNIIYKLEEKTGGLFAKVTAYYSHQGTRDWRTTDYRTYTRVYVPQGSRLVSSEGFLSEVTAGQDEDYIVQTCSKTEKDKMFFGGFLKIAPGKIGNFTIEYQLPDRLYRKLDQGEYKLTLQKQPGNRVSEVQVDIKPDRTIKAYIPTGFSADKISSGEIIWKTDLTTDKSFEVKL
ncbi:MAG: DUF4012 domain-containing protein [Patescibacteria group bacterium]|jgi:hypothetical protein